jgi:hypothetical protein
LKKKQLATAKASDQTLAHYEQDHLISLELGGLLAEPRRGRSMRREIPDLPAGG